MKRKKATKKSAQRCIGFNQTGDPCKNVPLKGFSLCRRHCQPAISTVSIVTIPEAQPYELLERCLKQASFWERLESTRSALRKSKTGISVVIKPDLEHYGADSSRGASPRLVEHLIALLHRRGYTSVVIADGPGTASAWLDNRNAAALADLAGYRYATDDGGAYDVLDLAESCADAGFGDGKALFGARISKHWIDADFRICFGKNKTHEEDTYALCLYTLMGVFPFHDKNYHCFARLPAPEIASELLEHLPVHFSIIDAVVSNHGADGVRMNNPLPTDTIIGSQSLLLADWAGALKMGLDPYASPLNAHALRTIGLPGRYALDGDLIPYKDWKNVPPLLADSVQKRNKTLLMRRSLQPWTYSVDRAYFPFKRTVDDHINQSLAPLLTGLDEHPFKMLAAISSNYLLAEAGRTIETYRILYAKEKLHRKNTSIGVNPSLFTDKDFTGIPDYIEPLETVAVQAAPDRNGLRWRTIDRSVVIAFTRILPFAFDDFTASVDIAGAVRIMNDNIGGAAAPILRNDKGLIIRQIERDIYLPQPNWMALFGGDFIDVTKLELVRRLPDEHAVYWKTVASPNHSARFDDGIVRFTRTGNDNVSVTIMARQDFTLPLIWQMANLDLLPHVKNPLISDAYLTYFGRTIASYEAAYAGHDVRTGRDFVETDGESRGGIADFIPASIFKKFATAPVMELLKSFIEKGPAALTEINPLTKDVGSAASKVVSTLSEVMKDLFDAIHKDLRPVIDPDEKEPA